ncbi:MAG: hypothetical protein ABSG39_09000, partial [Acidimicrobiales bacterium]
MCGTGEHIRVEYLRHALAATPFEERVFQVGDNFHCQAALADHGAEPPLITSVHPTGLLGTGHDEDIDTRLGQALQGPSRAGREEPPVHHP